MSRSSRGAASAVLRPRLAALPSGKFERRTTVLLVYLNIGVFFLAGILGCALAGRELEAMEEALDLQSTRFTSDAAPRARTRSRL